MIVLKTTLHWLAESIPTASANIPNIDLVNIAEFCRFGLNCTAGDANAYINPLALAGADAFLGVLVAMLILYTLKLVLGARDEGQLTEVKQAYGHAILGAILVASATVIAQSFTTDASSGVINAGAINTSILQRVITFMSGIIGTLLIANLTIQGARLIIAQDEGQIDKARKSVFSSMLAVAVALVATPIVQSVSGATNPGIISEEFRGIADFIITIFGALAVVAVIIGGVMLIISVDESLKDKARRTIVGALIALVVVISSYSIVNFFS